ncbi:hypothetical protein C8F04DRAFT_1143781 [Mycena alexandri]|uniref:Uncharacterized protein n=1 Tax=Mycena alexandri TaxID=1745969 RepID=A0AAD6WN23_9AGAR|nr:hypothetical protein C8F04DRAFT_1143781 [Mycena alexandri]
MPASNSKDRVTIIGIRQVPHHLSKEVFETKMGALLDAFMALPVCKKNVLKWDLILPMPSSFDASIRAIGFSEPQSHVLAVAECETTDHWAEVFADPEWSRLVMEGEKEFNFCSSSQTFFTDVVTKIEGVESVNPNPVRSVWILKAQSRFSRDEFSDKLGGFVDQLLAMPKAQKTFHKHVMFLPSTMDTSDRGTDTMLRGLGLPVPEPAVVLVTESKSQEDVIELCADQAVKELMKEATAELELHVNSVAFLGNLQSKGNRA